VLEEINFVKQEVNRWSIQIVGLRLLCRSSGFVQTIDLRGISCRVALR